MRSLLFLIPALLCAETLDVFDHHWTVQRAADWSIEAGALRLIVPGVPPPGLPRRPQKYALADTKPFRSVTVEAEVKRNQRSLVIVYAWQDESHYNYAHISSDAAAKQPVHNGMFHVFGGERVRMSPFDGPPALPTADWTTVSLTFDGESGRCYVEVNGKRNPSLEAMDMSLRWGRVGLGSFDETGDFRRVRISGVAREPGQVGFK